MEKGGNLKTEKTEYPDQNKDRRILVAVDESENAKRVVLYVADFLGGLPGFRVNILNIIPKPSEDDFDAEADQEKYIEERKAKAEEMLGNYRQVLLQSGFSEEKVEVKLEVRDCPSIADFILEEQKRLGCCTLVIGRRGISKKEEFLYGSTSNRVLHSAKNCAVWVIE